MAKEVAELKEEAQILKQGNLRSDIFIINYAFQICCHCAIIIG